MALKDVGWTCADLCASHLQPKPSGGWHYLEESAQSVDPLRCAENGKGRGEDTNAEKAQSNKFSPRGKHRRGQDVEHLRESFVGFRCAVEAVDRNGRKVQIGNPPLSSFR